MKLSKWDIGFFFFTAIFGTLLHFVYDWSGQSTAAALFAPVNESTWEHLKLLFFPALLFTAIQYFFVGQEQPGFLPARVFAICLGLFVIAALFYTYSGILGKNFLWADIGTFLVGVGVATYFTRRWTPELAHLKGTALLLLLLLVCLFFLFSFNAPHIGLFRDPVTGGYCRL